MGIVTEKKRKINGFHREDIGRHRPELIFGVEHPDNEDWLFWKTELKKL